MGTPIRLVRNDGGIIELMATTLTMNVDRGVSPLPLPFAGGSRFAFDLNLPKALITIEGVMTDDDLLNNPGTTTHAIGLNTPVSTTLKVYLAKQNSTFQGLDGGSGRYFIAVHDGTNPRTASQIAVSLTTLINTYSSTFKLTANTINSPISGETDTAVELTQTVSGKSGNRLHPSWDDYSQAVGNTVVYKPYHTIFSGGRDSSATANKSAGDKVAELFAVLNNSNNGGGGGKFGGGSFAGIGENVKNILKGNLEFNFGIGSELKYGDYITAIQIPFTSNINSNESLFYMPTGGMRVSTDKTADRAKPAGTKFDISERKYTGIKGSVANATFVQLGGEPLYSYTINFAPIDWIF